MLFSLLALLACAAFVSCDPMHHIKIDGKFNDWDSVPKRSDPYRLSSATPSPVDGVPPMPDVHSDEGTLDQCATRTAVYNPYCDLIQAAVTHDEKNIYAYFKSVATMNFTAPGGRLYIQINIDADNDIRTGYCGGMGGYYPSQCGVDVAFELEMYNNKLNTAHYLQHSLEKQSDVDNAMKLNKEGLQYFAPALYKPYTEYVYWTADAPPTRDESERCQQGGPRTSGPYQLPNGAWICFVDDMCNGPYSGAMKVAFSTDGRQLEIGAPFEGFLRNNATRALAVSLGKSVSIQLSLETSPELGTPKIWASDATFQFAYAFDNPQRGRRVFGIHESSSVVRRGVAPASANGAIRRSSVVPNFVPLFYLVSLWPIGCVWQRLPLVGAPTDNRNASGVYVGGDPTATPTAPFSGAAYVFLGPSFNDSLKIYIKAAQNNRDVLFGFAVAAATLANTGVICAPEDTSIGTGVNPLPNQIPAGLSIGACRVFRTDFDTNNRTAAVEVAYLKPLNSIVGTGQRARFGSSVAMSADGTLIVAGAPAESSNAATGIFSGPLFPSLPGAVGAGAAYSFRLINGTWTAEVMFKGPNVAGVNFGDKVAVSTDGTYLAVGCKFNSGGVWLYRFFNGNWTFLQTLPCNSTCTVSFDATGRTLAVASVASVNIFTRSGTGFQLSGSISPGGTSVALASDGLGVVFGDPSANQAYAYGLINGAWSLFYTAQISGSNQFGFALSVADTGAVAISDYTRDFVYVYSLVLQSCQGLPSCSCNGTTCTVQGSLTLSSALALSTGSQTVVTGDVTFTLSSSLSIAVFGNSSVPLLSVQGNANISGIVIINVNSVGTTTVVIIEASSISGSFTGLQVSSSDPCLLVNGQQLQQTATSVSVIIQTTPATTGTCVPVVNGTTSATSGSSGLSTGALIGIIVGSAVGGILIILVVILVSRALVLKRTSDVNRSIKETQLNEVRAL